MYQSPTEVIKRVGLYLSVAMPSNKDKMVDHLLGLEACRYDLSQKVTEWHQLVADTKQRALRPKEKEYTELDRTVMMDADISLVRKDYEFLVKLEELVRDRIELGKTLLIL